ncbi:hypothetical protein HBB16_11155 [Pseudonocardia sp. MCCB 268]|nr:hypothetical protein [Pseudonocardia cytotoxica]
MFPDAPAVFSTAGRPRPAWVARRGAWRPARCSTTVITVGDTGGVQYRHAPTALRRPRRRPQTAPGAPDSPVRLTVELLGGHRARLRPRRRSPWDPCCGAGALTVSLLCPGITALAGTDADLTCARPGSGGTSAARRAGFAARANRA